MIYWLKCLTGIGETRVQISTDPMKLTDKVWSITTSQACCEDKMGVRERNSRDKSGINWSTKGSQLSIQQMSYEQGCHHQRPGRQFNPPILQSL